MGRFWDILQRHMDAQPYGVSERQIARAIGVSPSTLANWREVKGLVDKEHLVAVAQLTHVPYERVLDAMLEDIGYLHEGDPDPPTVLDRARSS